MKSTQVTIHVLAKNKKWARPGEVILYGRALCAKDSIVGVNMVVGGGGYINMGGGGYINPYRTLPRRTLPTSPLPHKPDLRGVGVVMVQWIESGAGPGRGGGLGGTCPLDFYKSWLNKYTQNHCAPLPVCAPLDYPFWIRP